MAAFEGSIICTKPESDLRFYNADEKRVAWLRYAGLELECGSLGPGCYSYKQPSFYFAVKFLCEAENVALIRAIVGKSDYKPHLDIDRYLVECGGFYVKNGTCPVFDEIKRVLREENSAVGLKHNLDDGCGSSFACNGDGRVGPIASVLKDDFEFIPSEEDLAAICKNCKYRCDETGERASDHAELVEFVPSNPFNFKIVQKSKNEVKKFHGGIIAFLRRMFGRRSQTKGKVK